MTDHSPNNAQGNYLLDTWVYREAFEEKVVRIITCVATCQGRIDFLKAGRGHATSVLVV